MDDGSASRRPRRLKVMLTMSARSRSRPASPTGPVLHRRRLQPGPDVHVEADRTSSSSPPRPLAARPWAGRVYRFWNKPEARALLLFSRRARAGARMTWAEDARELWTSGYRGIVRSDPAVKDKVLFGETAAISSPMDTLYAALCLNQSGRPYKPGRTRRLMGCNKPSKLPIGAWRCTRTTRTRWGRCSPARPPRTPWPWPTPAGPPACCGAASATGGSRAGAACT